MGPNGNGKSTLLAAIMGNPKFHISEGSILLDGKDVLAMEVDERSRAGLFLGMQYPSEISGVTNSEFFTCGNQCQKRTSDSIIQLYQRNGKNHQTDGNERRFGTSFLK